jgi:hypothetical protein
MLNIDFDFEENLKLFDKISDKTGSKARKQLYGQVKLFPIKNTSLKNNPTFVYIKKVVYR